MGVIVGLMVSPAHQLDAKFGSVEDAWAELASPAAGIALALLIRFGTSIAGFVLAIPLMRSFDATARAPGRYAANRFRLFFDRVNTARGYGYLRFTHYVQVAAEARLGEASAPYERIDRVLRAADVALPAIAVLSVVVLALIG